jgi:hypothetical protein
MENAPFASVERTVLMRVRDRLRPELLRRGRVSRARWLSPHVGARPMSGTVERFLQDAVTNSLFADGAGSVLLDERVDFRVQLGIARRVLRLRLHHCRDLGEPEPFDFLTWFEFSPEIAPAFDELVCALRSSPEWQFVDREVDIRVEREDEAIQVGARVALRVQRNF